MLKQECIPVGCVPSAAVAIWGGVCPEGCLPRGCVHLPPPRGQNSWHTLVKTLPFRNNLSVIKTKLVNKCGGNYSDGSRLFQRGKGAPTRKKGTQTLLFWPFFPETKKNWIKNLPVELDTKETIPKDATFNRNLKILFKQKNPFAEDIM